MGGDLVITDEGQHPKSWAWGERCNNCVQVMGTVYRKKTVDEKKAEKKKEEALAAAKAEKLGPDRQPAAIGAIPGASAQDEAPLAETKPTLEQMFPPKQETSHVVDEVLKSR